MVIAFLDHRNDYSAFGFLYENDANGGNAICRSHLEHQLGEAHALNEPTGWRFYAAIHGIDQNLWQKLGYWSPSDPCRAAAILRPIGTSASMAAGTSCPGIAVIRRIN
jgi:hypothetical protein